MKDTCLICNRITLAEQNGNKHFVAELQTGIVVLGDHQFFKGYTVFLSKIHLSELHLHPDRTLYLTEMARVGEAVWKTFNPKKLNYEILGNKDPHLHTHIFPRTNDQMFGKPLYYIPQNERQSVSTIPADTELVEMIASLRENLDI